MNPAKKCAPNTSLKRVCLFSETSFFYYRSFWAKFFFTAVQLKLFYQLPELNYNCFFILFFAAIVHVMYRCVTFLYKHTNQEYFLYNKNVQPSLALFFMPVKRKEFSSSGFCLSGTHLFFFPPTRISFL